MFTSLRHRTVRSADNKNSSIHLSGPRNHVLDVIGVSWTINMGVVTLFCFVLDVRNGNGNTSFSLFRSIIDGLKSTERSHTLLGEDLCDRGRQGRLTVINVTNSTDINVWFTSFKFFCHVFSLQNTYNDTKKQLPILAQPQLHRQLKRPIAQW